MRGGAAGQSTGPLEGPSSSIRRQWRTTCISAFRTFAFSELCRIERSSGIGGDPGHKQRDLSFRHAVAPRPASDHLSTSRRKSRVKSRWKSTPWPPLNGLPLPLPDFVRMKLVLRRQFRNRLFATDPLDRPSLNMKARRTLRHLLALSLGHTFKRRTNGHIRIKIEVTIGSRLPQKQGQNCTPKHTLSFYDYSQVGRMCFPSSPKSQGNIPLTFVTCGR